MYSGFDPEYLLKTVSRRQDEIRARFQEEARVRRDLRPLRGSRIRTFKLWQLHVMVWFEDVRGS